MPYLLDGNNLIGRFRGASRPGEEDRQALISELAGRLRQTRARAVVFFDGPAGSRGVTLGSLTVRASSGESADDAILREIRASRAPKEAIVVTGDRGLAERCRAAGASVCPPEEFMARFGKRGGGPAGARETGTVDVEEWTRYFADPGNRDGDRSE